MRPKFAPIVLTSEEAQQPASTQRLAYELSAQLLPVPLQGCASLVLTLHDDLILLLPGCRLFSPFDYGFSFASCLQCLRQLHHHLLLRSPHRQSQYNFHHLMLHLRRWRLPVLAKLAPAVLMPSNRRGFEFNLAVDDGATLLGS